MKKPVRLAYLVSHPIQYQAPLLRRIAQDPEIELTVLFGSDFSARTYRDEGFGVQVSWDIPLLAGYSYRVLPALRDTGAVSATAPLSRGVLRALHDGTGRPAFDALWVHGYASLNALHGIAAANLLGIPVLLRAESWSGDRQRSVPKQLAKRIFFRLLRPMVAAVLPIGSHNADYWLTSFGPSMPQFRMPYAIDNGFFAQRAAAARPSLEEERQRIGIAAGQPVILFASKLQPRKHADHLVQAVALLQQRTQLRPHLLVVGDGEERPRLEAMVREHGMAAAISFLGFRNQSELPGLFALAQVFVLPSRHEPWGLIVNEAMACGCPVVVSSDVGAAADLVEDGVTGFVYPAGDVAALSRALEASLLNPGDPVRLGIGARQRVATWDFEADLHGLREALAYTTRGLHA